MKRLRQTSTLGYSVRGRGRFGGGTSILTPAVNWRIPITATYVSYGADATFNTDSLAAHSTRRLVSLSGGTWPIPAATTTDISIKSSAIATPGGLFYFDTSINGGASQPTITVHESFDSVDGSAGSGNWTTNSFARWRPSGAPGTSFDGIGQIAQLAAGAERWIRLRVVTVAGQTAQIWTGLAQKQADGANDLHSIVGMSITSTTFTSRTTRDEIIRQIPTADPFIICMARSGANTAAIKSEQIDTLTGNSQFDGVLNVFAHSCPINDLAYTFKRPYSTDPDPTTVATQFVNNILSPLIAKYGASRVWATNTSFGNFTSADVTAGATPYVNGVITPTEPNGFVLYNFNQISPQIKALTPRSWSSKYDAPLLDEFAGQASDFAVYLSDSLHDTTIGTVARRNRQKEMFKLWYGLTGVPTIDILKEQAGIANTSTVKTNMQAMYDLMPATAEAGALANRATLQAAITAMTTTFADITPTGGAILPNDAGISSMTLVSQFDASEFTKFTRNMYGTVQNWTDRKNGHVMTQATVNNRPVSKPTRDTAAAEVDFLPEVSMSNKSLSSTDAALIGLLNAAGSACTVFVTMTIPTVAGVNGEDVFGIGSGSQNFLLVALRQSLCQPRFLFGDSGGSAFSLTVTTDTALVAGVRCAFAIRKDGVGNLKYYRGGVTETATTTRNAGGTGTVARIAQRAQGGGSVNCTKIIHEIDVFSGAGSDAEIGNVLAGLCQKWTDSSKTCI